LSIAEEINNVIKRTGWNDQDTVCRR
jgi:hypothetical protein